MPEKTPSQSVFHYMDYREFIRDRFEWLKDTQKHFSYRYFMRRSKITSPSHFKMVADGKRNLTGVSVEKYIMGLGLNHEEADYFRILVKFNQAKQDAQRNRFLVRLRKYIDRRNVQMLSMNQFDYFSNWHIPVIREMIACQWFENNDSLIRDSLFQEVTPEQIQKALQILEDLKLVSRDRSGKLVSKAGHLKTAGMTASLALKNYHREMMTQAAKSLERSRGDEREIHALTMCISSAKLAEAKQRVRDFVFEMRDFLAEPAGDLVYQLNLQLFNMTSRRLSS